MSDAPKSVLFALREFIHIATYGCQSVSCFCRPPQPEQPLQQPQQDDLPFLRRITVEISTPHTSSAQTATSNISSISALEAAEIRFAVITVFLLSRGFFRKLLQPLS